MLDDLQMIHTVDVQDTLGSVERQWRQLADPIVVPQAAPADVANVVYSAMGGSTVAAMMAAAYLDLPVPIQIVKDYRLPAYVSPQTLCIAASYSGTTEETLEALGQAIQKEANGAVVAGGGKLADIAREHNYPLALLPNMPHPRFATFATLSALLAILEGAGLVTGAADELAGAAEFVREQSSLLAATVPTKDNLAKQIAQECLGKSVVVYTGPCLSAAAYKWKIGFNENAKQVAWTGQYPDCNHNESTGWTRQPEHKPYAVIELRSSLEHPRIQKRFQVTERLLSGLRPAPIVVQVQGATLFEQLAYAVVLGDFVTVYTALLSGINPTPLELVDKLKKTLTE